MNKILHEKPEAVDYVRAFFVKWKDRLETDQGSDFLPDKRVGHQFSKAFLSLFLRYAHTNWPEKLSTDHYELAVRDSKFRSENYQEIKRQLNHEIRIRKPTRKVLMALLNTNGSAPPKGRLPVDGWHHLLAVAIHNVSVNYELNIGEEDFSNGRSAKAAVVIALSSYCITEMNIFREYSLIVLDLVAATARPARYSCTRPPRSDGGFFCDHLIQGSQAAAGGPPP